MLERTDTCDEQLDSLTRVPKVIGTFDMASRFLIELSVVLDTEEEPELAEVQEILYNHESQILELEGIDIEDESFQNVDEAILGVQDTIFGLTGGIMTEYLLGIEPDCFN